MQFPDDSIITQLVQISLGFAFLYVTLRFLLNLLRTAATSLTTMMTVVIEPFKQIATSLTKSIDGLTDAMSELAEVHTTEQRETRKTIDSLASVQKDEQQQTRDAIHTLAGNIVKKDDSRDAIMIERFDRLEALLKEFAPEIVQ